MYTKPYFIDTTLRDGEQAPGVAFSDSEKICIAGMLDEAGVPELEVGTPAMGPKEMNVIRAISRKGYRFKTLAWCRATEHDIRLSADVGTDGVHISFPVSDILLRAMGKDRSWVMSELGRMVRLGHSSFSYVTVGAQDASRAEPAFLTEFALAVMASGATRLRLADTVGLLNPFSTTSIVASIRKLNANFPLEFHGHNDLGMATANTLAAWMAGADCLSTTVNGLGERAGNAPMEEVALAIEFSTGTTCGLKTDRFTGLSRYVEAASGRTNSASKPVTGSMVLAHESGIHTRCLLQDRNTYQLIPADRIGQQEQELLLGKHSGKATIRHHIERCGLPFDDARCQLLLDQVRRISEKQKRLLSQDELVLLYHELFSNQNPILCLPIFSRLRK
jgi:homocitrate synthase NifV